MSHRSCRQPACYLHRTPRAQCGSCRGRCGLSACCLACVRGRRGFHRRRHSCAGCGVAGVGGAGSDGFGCPARRVGCDISPRHCCWCCCRYHRRCHCCSGGDGACCESCCHGHHSHSATQDHHQTGRRTRPEAAPVPWWVSCSAVICRCGGRRWSILWRCSQRCAVRSGGGLARAGEAAPDCGSRWIPT